MLQMQALTRSFVNFVYLILSCSCAVCESRAFQIDDDTMLEPVDDMPYHDTLGSSDGNIQAREWKVLDKIAIPGAEDEAELVLELYVCSPDTTANGTEMKISSGAVANGQLLIHYGFVLENNKPETISKSTSVPDNC